MASMAAAATPIPKMCIRDSCEVVERQLAIPRLDRQFVDFLFDFRNRHQIGIAHDRNDQPARGTDGNPDIVIPVIDDIVPVNRGIHDRETFQGCNRRLDEERHQAEPDTVFLFELFTELAAQIQNRLHVHFIERRQRGRLLL